MSEITMHYTIIIEHDDEFERIKMLLTDSEYEVIQRLCDASNSLSIGLG